MLTLYSLSHREPPKLTTECYDEDASSETSSHPPTSPLLSVDRSPTHSHGSSPSRGSRGSPSPRHMSRSPSPRIPGRSSPRAASVTGDYITGHSSLPRYHDSDSVNSVRSYPIGRRGHFSSPTPRTGSSLLSCVGRSHDQPVSERKTAMPLKLAQTQVSSTKSRKKKMKKKK